MSQLIDKTVNATVKTGTAAAKAGESLIKSSTKQGVNLLVNRTSDFYDRHENLTDGLAKSAIGNGAMVARSGYRVLRSGGRSVKNIRKRGNIRLSFIKEYFINKKGEEAWDALSDEEKLKLNKRE